MIIIEPFLYRAQCGSCGCVLWTDKPMKTECICSQSWIEDDGTLKGSSTDVSDEMMALFILLDQGRSVIPQKI